MSTDRSTSSQGATVKFNIHTSFRGKDDALPARTARLTRGLGRGPARRPGAWPAVGPAAQRLVGIGPAVAMRVAGPPRLSMAAVTRARKPDTTAAQPAIADRRWLPWANR